MMNEELKVKLLKESIKEIISRLGLTSKWKSVTSLVSDHFIDRNLMDNTPDGFNKLKENIRKSLTEEKRKNIELLNNLKVALDEKDHITKLCEKYLINFRKKEFFIPENDLKELKLKADNGHLLCQRTLGEYYQFGGNFGIPNIIDAHKYYTQSFEQYDWVSAIYLGKLYSEYPLYNEDIACKYYEYAILFYFEGKESSNYIPVKGNGCVSSYIKLKKDLFLSELACFVSDFNEKNINSLNSEERVSYLLKEISSFESYYLFVKIYEIFEGNMFGLRYAFKFLSNYYRYGKDDDTFFLISLLGSLCGELSSLSDLAMAFKNGKGTNKDLTLSTFCYILLYLIENDEKWKKPLNDIYLEVKSADINQTDEKLLNLLKQLI